MSNLADSKVCHVLDDNNIMTPAGVLFFSKYLVEGSRNYQGNLKYNLELCLPPDVDLKALKNAMGKVALENLDGDAAQAKNYVNKRFLDPNNKPDGGKPAGEEYNGWTLIRASSHTVPDFVWPNNKRMTVDEVKNSIESGDYVRATLNPYWLDTKTPDGVKIRGMFLGLQNVQLVKKGKAIGYKKPAAESQFGAVEGADDVDSESVAADTGSGSSVDELFN